MNVVITMQVGTCSHCLMGYDAVQWRTERGGLGGSTNSVEDRENGNLGAVAP
jgi:hypothetical protein